MFAGSSVAEAALIGVNGPDSSDNTAPAILGTPPAQLTNNAVTNTGQEGFDERQNVTLGASITTDQGSISSGTTVSSHMIFLNSPDGSLITHSDVEWEFDGDIIGTMSDEGGTLEAASTNELGLSGSTYNTFSNRGFETNFDDLSFTGNVLTIDMAVTNSGDWVRVVTAAGERADIPIPGTTALLGAGLFGLGLIGRRRHSG
jgi:hypothetical protein